LDLNVSNRRGLFACAQSVFAVVGDLEARHAGGAKAVDERRERTIAFAGEFNWTSIAEQSGAAADGAVAALGLESAKLPWGGALDVFAPEHGFQFCAADFAAEPVHLFVGDWAEFALHFLGEQDAELGLE